jgi:ATP-dependent Clp protease ATP-binding subunit ClpC
VAISSERMTDRARHVMALAEQEARRRGAAAVESEHVLLGLALEGSGVAAHVLRYVGASAEKIAQELPAVVPAPANASGPLPWAVGTEQAVARAHEELVPLGHNYVGTEHLVLGVVQAGKGMVPEVLARLGVAAEAVRRQVYDLLGHGL